MGILKSSRLYAVCMGLFGAICMAVCATNVIAVDLSIESGTDVCAYSNPDGEPIDRDAVHADYVEQVRSKNPRAVPTFECMSLYWDCPDHLDAAAASCKIRYRQVGEGRWYSAQPLWYDARQRQYRGSVVNLRPGTNYEFSFDLTGASKPAVSQRIVRQRTWSTDLPIAAKAVLPAGTSNETIRIDHGGSVDGYRLYTAAPGGSTIDVADNEDTCISIETDYVIVRNATCRGARVDGLRIGNHHHVVIEGCEITDWGRPDSQAGKTIRIRGEELAIPSTLGAHLDAGIHIDGPDSHQIIIQGNRIHHPRYTANNWTQVSPHFSNNNRLSTHPQGPNAIVFSPVTRGRHVIRWNDIGSDQPDFAHMFNDAVLASEPLGNGFPRDGDIYGNRISNCWDDGIEAERGDRNVRVWGNHFSRVIKCVSAGYIWEGPLYVYRNVGIDLLHPNEMSEHNGGRSPFLAHPPCFMPPPQEDSQEERDGIVFVYHNSLLNGSGAGAGWAFNTWTPHRYASPSVRLVSRNNLWQTRAYPAYFHAPNDTGRNFMVRDFEPSYFDQDYDLHSGIITPPETAGANSQQAEPMFRKGHGIGILGRYQLARRSPGHDDGVRLPNFNDDFVDSGPDRGALETGAEDVKYGVVLWHNSNRDSAISEPQAPKVIQP